MLSRNRQPTAGPRPHRVNTLACALLALTLAGLVLPARAQTPAVPSPPAAEEAPPRNETQATAPTLRVQARIVAVTALVRDAHGNLVTHLTKDDFQVREDGKLQTIRYFNADNDLPLTLGLLVDTSGSLRGYSGEEQSAAALFLKSMLTRAEDRAFLERFDSEVTLLQPMTSRVPDLARALPWLAVRNPKPAPPGAGTLLFDALCATLRHVVGSEIGRRALIVLTDGEDQGSQNTVREAIQLAQANDVAVYTILFPSSDPSYVRHTGHTGRELMERMSNEAGGALFPVTRTSDIAAAFTSIEHELRSQYRLGYVPPPSPPFSYHGLQVQVGQPGLAVLARGGYYTPRPLSPVSPSPPDLK